MAIPARVLCRWQEGKHQVALAEGEQRGHFKNHLRHFCIMEAPLPPGPSEDAQGQAEVGKGARLRGQEWGRAGHGTGKPR